jgi:hypothetical protein
MGTLSRQVVMKGFMDWKFRPWLRRLITRLAPSCRRSSWAARLFGADAVNPETQHDKAYLETVRFRLASAGMQVEAELV